MNEQQDRFFEQKDYIENVEPIPEQYEPLPPKSALESQKKPVLKHVEIVRESQYTLYRPFKLEKRQETQEEQVVEQVTYDSPFTEFYEKQQCVYMRFNNKNFNRLQGRTYYSGVFANRNIFSDLANPGTHEIADILNEYYDITEPVLMINNAKNIKFDSRFQSGNLFAAFKVSQYEYDLTMSNDTNSTGSNQWFYFSVEGMKPKKEYTFSVINFTKNDALFNYGMKPVVYSMAENRGVPDIERGWKRTGNEVSYKRGKLPRQYSNRMYYRLSFKLSTNHNKDKLFIAHSYPYTLEKLHLYLNDKKTRNKQFVTRVQIGKTLTKRSIQGLVISYPVNKKRDNRKAVIIMARQHPGQCQGSYVCEGVVDRLLARTKQSEYLLKNYVFVVIPMINPDGVVFGHYRTNLAGKDLNRKWNASEKDLNCPEVTAIKTYLNQLSQNRQIRFILDLHGHSRKLNSFFYGNPFPDSPEAVRIFPFICSRLHSGVQYLDCTFTTEQYKRKAARVYLNYMFKLVHVYTFQSSFYCYEKEGNRIEFTPKQYRQLGETLVSGLFLQLQHEVKYQESICFIGKKNSKQYNNSNFVRYLSELRGNKILMQVGDSAESGSDSRPEQGEINNQELQYHKKERVSSSLQKQSISKTSRPRRKANSESKEHSVRPFRNLKLIEISKINSFMPDKNFCLQPIRKIEPEGTPKMRNFRSTMSSQTDMMNNSSQLASFTLAEIQNASLSMSFVQEQSPSRKTPSMMRSLHIKNSIIFRMDYQNARPERQVHQQVQAQKKKNPDKNALSQTILTFAKELPKQSKTPLLPDIEVPSQQQTEPFLLRSAQIKIETPLGMMNKKEDENFFNNMVRRFLENKEKSKNKSFHTPVSRSVLDKSFTIKRKDSKK